MVNVISAVKAVIKAKWLTRKIYADYFPKNAARSCFYIESGKKDAIPHTRNTISITANYTITVLETLDNYGEESQAALIQTQTDLISLFDVGMLKAGDRSVNVKASGEGSNIGEAYVNLVVTYVDDKNETKPTYQTMQDININYERRDS